MLFQAETSLHDINSRYLEADREAKLGKENIVIAEKLKKDLAVAKAESDALT